MGKKETLIHVDTRVQLWDKDFLQLYLVIPRWSVAGLTEGKITRVICELNGVSFSCALRPLEKGGDFFIGLSKEKSKKARVLEGMEVQVTLKKDESEYGFPMPEELHEVLEQDHEAKEIFQKIKPGKRRGWMHYVDSAKGVDTRIKRAFHIVERMKEDFYNSL